MVRKSQRTSEPEAESLSIDEMQCNSIQVDMQVEETIKSIFTLACRKMTRLELLEKSSRTRRRRQKGSLTGLETFDYI